MENKKFEVAGNVSIISTGQKTVVKEEFEKQVDNIVSPSDVNPGSTLTEMYDRFSKLLYAIDASGSMGEGMLSEDSLKRYKWTPELLESFRAAMRADQQLLEEGDTVDDGPEEWLDEEDQEAPQEAPSHVDVDAMTDEDVKRMIVFNHLDQRYNIDLQMDYSVRLKSRSKMMALKDAAKDFVHQRFQKFPDAKVAVFQFEDHPQMLCAAGASEQEVLNAINRLPDMGGGGTNIYRAVDRVVNECQKRPSEVGLHHIVLVSDGCDGGGVKVKELVPKMKELGIVFDFIYMVGASEDQQGGEVAKAMRWVCEMTGGEYVVVKTEQDFEQKFLAVSNRPMLPPARS